MATRIQHEGDFFVHLHLHTLVLLPDSSFCLILQQGVGPQGLFFLPAFSFSSFGKFTVTRTHTNSRRGIESLRKTYVHSFKKAIQQNQDTKLKYLQKHQTPFLLIDIFVLDSEHRCSRGRDCEVIRRCNICLYIHTREKLLLKARELSYPIRFPVVMSYPYITTPKRHTGVITS